MSLVIPLNNAEAKRPRPVRQTDCSAVASTALARVEQHLLVTLGRSQGFFVEALWDRVVLRSGPA